MENIEVWKPVVGYEGLYEVSNQGKVKSLPRNTTNGMIRKLRINRRGYLIINLYKDGKRKTKLVHRLVAEAFIPNPNNLPCVNHKSEKKFENYVWVNKDGTIDLDKSNLEWCTIEYNVRYGTGIERRAKTQLNKQNSRPVKQLNLDGTLVYIWPSLAEAGRNGFSYGNIRSCCNGNKYTHKGYKWEYA